MLSRFVRTILAPVALVIPAALAACSSQSPEQSAQTDEAITKCGPGFNLSCDVIEGSHPLRAACTCLPFEFYTVARPPTAGSDTCGTVEVAVPPGLAPYGCTSGVLVDNQPVWACPAGTPLPSSLRVVNSPKHQPLPVCVWGVDDSGLPVAVWTTGAPCEAVEGFTHSNSNCIGDAPHGWKFILDAEWEFSDIDGGHGGGCRGQCGVATPPTNTLGGDLTHG